LLTTIYNTEDSPE